MVNNNLIYIILKPELRTNYLEIISNLDQEIMKSMNKFSNKTSIFELSGLSFAKRMER